MISDTHYNHENIVLGVSNWNNKEPCRKFDTLEEHNDTIVNNINKYVQRNDYLYHLGDWSFGGRQSIVEFRKRINCRNIVLTYGNHDMHIRNNKLIETNNEVIRPLDLFTYTNELIDTRWMNRSFVLCHYPILSWQGQEKGAIHVYGHIHKELAYHKNAVCVSMECTPKFAPVSVEQIIEIVNNRNDDDFASYSKRDTR